jgi:hypothetical protein
MERRYVVAALAIIATFAIFSNGLKSLAHFSMVRSQRAEAVIGAKCSRESAAASAWAKQMQTRLRPGYAGEAQLLAEMNLPIAIAQIKISQQRARQNALAQCARAAAMRDMERARRDMLKLRSNMTRCKGNGSPQPIGFEEAPGEAFAQRVSFAVATSFASQEQQFARQQERLARDQQSFVADQVRQATENFNSVDDDSDSASGGDLGARCNNLRWQEQAKQFVLGTTRRVKVEVDRFLASM